MNTGEVIQCLRILIEPKWNLKKIQGYRCRIYTHINRTKVEFKEKKYGVPASVTLY